MHKFIGCLTKNIPLRFLIKLLSLPCIITLMGKSKFSEEKQKINVLWFKRDLRTRDHLPLKRALESDNKCLAIYIFEPLIENNYDFDIRHWQFVYHSLIELQKKIPIALFYGHARDIFQKLMTEYSIDNVYSHQETGVAVTFERDKELKVFKKREY